MYATLNILEREAGSASQGDAKRVDLSHIFQLVEPR